MGVRILRDEANALAALFCSTSDFAFGPVFHDTDGRPADERAEAFVRYVNAHPENNPISGLFWKFDIRHLSDEQLERKYTEWLAQEEDQFAKAARDEMQDFLQSERQYEIDEARAEERAQQEMRLHPERFR